ncbi:hypothetical protein [Ekhidna sp. To15]|uniref:hypothetical protein n=1 Tax=Ekhidna sp. To15 TaxID=3395267 RepID=UPI003F51F6A6
MESNEQKGAGLALIIGSVLMIATMVLHPVGGDFDQLLKIVTIGIISHSLAILSVPFVAYGFFGLTMRLKSSSFLSYTGFSMMLFALVAAMMAAATNGLILTDMVKSYEGASEETIASLKPLFVFMRSFNHAFDYIFMGGVCLSILFWSIAMLKTKSMKSWVGYFGIFLAATSIILFLSGFELLHLAGFRVFIFGNVAWILTVGFYLRNSKE